MFNVRVDLMPCLCDDLRIVLQVGSRFYPFQDPEIVGSWCPSYYSSTRYLLLLSTPVIQASI